MVSSLLHRTGTIRGQALTAVVVLALLSGCSAAPPLSKPCEALSYHGFLGKENEVVKTITDWLSGKPIFVTIGP